MCESMLEKVKDESIPQEEKTIYAPMLSTLSNVHDELIEIWQNIGEAKLSELLGENISDRVVFDTEVSRKMSNLIEFEDELSAEDRNKALEHISKNYARIEELCSWLNKYINHSDSYIKTVAIEAIALLNSKVTLLKSIEEGLKRV